MERVAIDFVKISIDVSHVKCSENGCRRLSSMFQSNFNTNDSVAAIDCTGFFFVFFLAKDKPKIRIHVTCHSGCLKTKVVMVRSSLKCLLILTNRTTICCISRKYAKHVHITFNQMLKNFYIRKL